MAWANRWQPKQAEDDMARRKHKPTDPQDMATFTCEPGLRLVTLTWQAGRMVAG